MACFPLTLRAYGFCNSMLIICNWTKFREQGMVWTFVASVIQSYSNPLQFDKLRNQGMVWTFVVSLASSWIKVVVQSPVELHRVVIHQPYNPLSSEWCKKLRGTCHKFFPFFLSFEKKKSMFIPAPIMQRSSTKSREYDQSSES